MGEERHKVDPSSMSSAAVSQRTARFRATEECLRMLFDRFPSAFLANPRRRRPLKIGIDKDIASLLAGLHAKRRLSTCARGAGCMACRS